MRFESLTREQISEIVDLQVARVIERVAERGVQVTLSDRARELLGNMGYDPTYGARPLKRVIQKQLTDRLALALLAGEIRVRRLGQGGHRRRGAGAGEGRGGGGHGRRERRPRRPIRYKRTLSATRARPAKPTEEPPPMPTYIMLTTLTPEGVQTVKNNPQRIQEVNKEVEQLGAMVKAQWATLGHIDFISVVEAPDEGAMARLSLELGSRGTARYETLSAIPIDDFIASL